MTKRSALKARALIAHANELRLEADLLLRRSRLLKLLSSYGNVNITGSYRLNLMTKPDIDIHIFSPRIGKSAVRRILDRLIAQNFFDGYHFHDWVAHFEEGKSIRLGMLKGYYIGLRKVFRKKRWKIDLWFLRWPDPKGGRVMKLIETNADADARETILKLKRIRDEKRLEIPSALIYQAVLTRGIRRLPALLGFQGREA